jgi:hypothetical protein
MFQFYKPNKMFSLTPVTFFVLVTLDVISLQRCINKLYSL